MQKGAERGEEGSEGCKGDQQARTRAVVDGPKVRNVIGMPQPPPPPLVSDADRRALHELGYLELPKVPEWELLAFCEKCATVGLNPD